MQKDAGQLVNNSFERKEGYPLPTHCYCLFVVAKRFDVVDVIQVINTREKVSNRRQSPTSTSVTICLLREVPVGRRGASHLSLLNAPNIRLRLGTISVI